jgi:hypothetical protein
VDQINTGIAMLAAAIRETVRSTVR